MPGIRELSAPRTRSVRWRWSLASLLGLPEQLQLSGCHVRRYRMRPSREHCLIIFRLPVTLRVETDGEYVLGDVSDIEAVKSQLAGILGITFDESDSWAHGYPTERAAMGNQFKPGMDMALPELCIAWFVRSDDPRYHELKDLMPGMSLRYPEIPENSYLLSATDGVLSRVLDACRKFQFCCPTAE